MLRHATEAEQDTGRNTHSDELRVTPEELAAAAAALEAAREAEERRRERTLPLREAVEQLGMALPPDALRAEVERLRAERAGRAAAERSLRWLRRFAAAAGLAVTVALAVLLLQSRRALHAATAAPPPLPLQRLSTVPDGVPVHMDSATLEDLAEGKKTAADVLADVRRATPATARTDRSFSNEWTVVRKGGSLLVRAWASADQAVQAANGGAPTVFSSPPQWVAREEIVALDIPAWRFGMDSGWQSPFVGHDAAGKPADAAGSVVQVANLGTPDSVVARTADAYIQSREPDLDSDIKMAPASGVLHMTGDVNADAAKGKAGALALDAIHRIGAPYRLSNELNLPQ